MHATTLTLAAPRIGILALQGDVAEHSRAVRAVGAEPVAVRRASEINSLAGLIIPGGESTTISKLLDAFELFEPLQQKIRAGLPVYGTCAGLILLADDLQDPRSGQKTLGGLDISVRRNAFGRQVDSFECDLTVAGLSAPDVPFRTVFIRAPWIDRAGPGVEILARVPNSSGQDAGVNAADSSRAGKIVAVRQDALMATSFHPEVTSDHRMHELFVNMVRSA